MTWDGGRVRACFFESLLQMKERRALSIEEENRRWEEMKEEEEEGEEAW